MQLSREIGKRDELTASFMMSFAAWLLIKWHRNHPVRTLQPTALVHEAYIRLVGLEARAGIAALIFFPPLLKRCGGFLSITQDAKKSLKRGGEFHHVEFEDAIITNNKPLSSDKLLALDEALKKLENIDKIKAELVKLRFFTGLTIEQAASFLGISHATAERYWDYARSWLHLEITKEKGKSEFS